MTTANRGPGVKFPPPFLWVAAFVGGWLLNRVLLFEIDDDGAGTIQSALGAVVLVAGLAINFWGLGTFLRARTAIIPHRPARALVESGPFRYSRNPMYIAITMQYVGLALLLNFAWPLVFLPLVLALLVALVIRREEAYLRRDFGPDYDDYCRRVGRWL
jgi:protein-S-isoprenylcysteine O-methyltransferase Ste14